MCFGTSHLISHQLYETGTKQGSSKDMWHNYVCTFKVKYRFSLKKKKFSVRAKISQ